MRSLGQIDQNSKEGISAKQSSTLPMVWSHQQGSYLELSPTTRSSCTEFTKGNLWPEWMSPLQHRCHTAGLTGWLLLNSSCLPSCYLRTLVLQTSGITFYLTHCVSGPLSTTYVHDTKCKRWSKCQLLPLSKLFLKSGLAAQSLRIQYWETSVG